MEWSTEIHKVIILCDNYPFPLPVRSFIVLKEATHLTANTRGVPAGCDKRYLSYKIMVYANCLNWWVGRRLMRGEATSVWWRNKERQDSHFPSRDSMSCLTSLVTDLFCRPVKTNSRRAGHDLHVTCDSWRVRGWNPCALPGVVDVDLASPHKHAGISRAIWI